jgi:hypothetical protein
LGRSRENIQDTVNGYLPQANHVTIDLATSHTQRLIFPDDKEAAKQLDSGISIGKIFPSVVVEVGMSESYVELKRDAWEWLWGSDGLVKLVIVIKLSKPTSQRHDNPPQHTDWSAFLELWEKVGSGTLAIIFQCSACILFSRGDWKYRDVPS